MSMTDPEPTSALAPREVAEALRAALAALRTECAGLPAAVLRWHPAAGEWCVLEVLGHLIEAEERGFAGRVRTLLAEPDPEFRTWDPGAVTRARQDCGRHPEVGRLSVADLLAEWVHHDRNHQRQILANVQAYVWPHMGNARRFSRPEP
jgi:DinB superfamily